MALTSTFAKIRKLSRLRVGMRCVACSAASLWLRVRIQSIAVPFENPVTRVLRKFAYSA